MIQLLAQNWYIARHQPLVWLVCALMLFISTGAGSPDRIPLDVIAVLGLVYPVLSAVYIGQQCSSGNLDRQVISGFSRTAIYAANFLTILLLCLLVLAAALLGNLFEMANDYGRFVYSVPEYLLFILGEILNTASYAALLTLIGMAFADRRRSRSIWMLIAAFCVIFGMGFFGSILDSQLQQPPIIVYNEIVLEGPETAAQANCNVANPDFISEPLRSQYESILRFLPVTQSLQLVETANRVHGTNNMLSLYRICADAVLLIFATSAIGLLIFVRRNLN